MFLYSDDANDYRGRKSLSAPPPSEPYERISRIKCVAAHLIDAGNLQVRFDEGRVSRTTVLLSLLLYWQKGFILRFWALVVPLVSFRPSFLRGLA